MSPAAYLFPFLAIVFWAGNVIVSKMAASAISPTAITFYRLVLAIALLSPFLVRPIWRNRDAIRRHWWQLAIGGLLSMALFQALSYRAAESTTATNMAIVTALIPLLTAILSAALLGDAVTLGMAVGGVLSFGGILYLVGHGDIGAVLAQGAHLGDVLMLFAALAYSLYGVLLKRWRMAIPAWQSTYMQAAFALVFMFPAFLATPAPLRALNRETLPLIAYAGGLASVVLPFLWIRGVQILGPSRCAAFMNLLPVMTALGAILMLGEPVRLHHIIGGGAALAGVACAETFRRPLRIAPATLPKTVH